MMRALYTAATGMISEQTNVDTIANNLSNVNTYGYKAQRTEFKSLLYQTIQTRTTSANGDQKPVGAQVGLGTRIAATTSLYTQGNATATEGPTDFMIDGKGFFAVRGTDGNTYYTRNGAFTWSLAGDGTTTATVLAYFMVKNGMKYIMSGANPIEIRKGMQIAKDECIKQIKESIEDKYE